MEIISDVNKHCGMTIIMVLHDINHARMFTDEIVIINNHHIYLSGKPDEVLTEKVISEVFGVKADTFTNSKGDSVILPMLSLDS